MQLCYIYVNISSTYLLFEIQKSNIRLHIYIKTEIAFNVINAFFCFGSCSGVIFLSSPENGKQLPTIKSGGLSGPAGEGCLE